MIDPEAILAELRERMRELPRARADAAETVRRLGEETVTRRSSDGHVTVSANGQGTITGIELSADALRRLDSHTLAEHLTAAVNACLDASESLQSDQRPGAEGLDETLDEAMDMFSHRMNGILDRLDQIGNSLETE